MAVYTKAEFEKKFGKGSADTVRANAGLSPQGESWWKPVVKDPIKTLIVKPGTRIAQAGVAAYGAATNNPQLMERAYQDTSVSIPLLGKYDIEGQRTGLSGVKQIAGDAAKTASYLYTPVKGAQVIKQGLGGAVRQGAIQGAKAGFTGGALYSGGQAAIENKSLGQIGGEALKGGAIGGVAGGVIGGAVPLASKGIQKGYQLGKKGATKLGEIGSSISKDKDVKLLSMFTGEDDDVIKAAMRNPKAADLGIQSGDEALRDAVRKGSEASIKARQEFSKGYNDAFDQLVSLNPNKLVGSKKVLYQIADDLQKSGVKIAPDGTLDFTLSKISVNPGEVSKVNQAYNVVRNWDDWSLSGVNKLKQMVGALTKFPSEAGGVSKSPFLGKFYHYLDTTIESNLPKNSAKLYRSMNNKFSRNIELYDDMVEAFNSGDPFKKLASSFSKNNDSLRQTLGFYEKTTGNDVMPIVAGRTLSQSRRATGGVFNPRTWVDFFIDPKYQAQIVTKAAKAKQRIIPKGGAFDAFKQGLKDTNVGLSIKSVSNQADDLMSQARKYKTAEEFVKAQNNVYHGGSPNLDLTKPKPQKSSMMISSEKGIYLSDTPKLAEMYAKNFGPEGKVYNFVLDKNAKIFDINNINDKKILFDILKNTKEKGLTDLYRRELITKLEKGLKGKQIGYIDTVKLENIFNKLENLGYDGMRIHEGIGETSTHVWNNKILKTKSQLTDIWNKANNPVKQGIQETNVGLSTKNAGNLEDKFGDYTAKYVLNGKVNTMNNLTRSEAMGWKQWLTKNNIKHSVIKNATKAAGTAAFAYGMGKNLEMKK